MSDRRILIDVSGGLVQEVFATPGLGVKIYRIDWDNIKEGEPTAAAWDEWDPIELTLDEFRARLKEAEEEHAGRRVCYHCDASLVKDGKIVHDESTCPTLLWQKDAIQFPRLLAEIRALGLTESQKLMLGRSMDLEVERIDELLDRAEAEFEKLKPKKEEEAPPDASGTTD